MVSILAEVLRDVSEEMSWCQSTKTTVCPVNEQEPVTCSLTGNAWLCLVHLQRALFA